MTTENIEETKTTWEGVVLNISPGDIITSKTGILLTSPLTKKVYRWWKAEYLSNGGWRIIGKKEEVNASEV